MGRLVFSWVCVFALVALPVAGCSDESTGAGGTGGMGGDGGSAGTGGAGGEGLTPGALISAEEIEPFADGMNVWRVLEKIRPTLATKIVPTLPQT